MAVDCTECGACCVAPRRYSSYVGLSAADREALSADQAEEYLAHQLSEPLYGAVARIRTKLDACGNNVCAALEGKIGERVACAIYAERPEPCRRFEQASAPCILARASAGLDPWPTEPEAVA